MKKIILMAVAATLALSLVACSRETNNAKDSNPTPDSSQSTSQETASIKTYMGEISGKVGNDITLSIGKLILENDGGEGQTMMVDENGNQVPVDGDMGDDAGGQTIMIPMPDDAGAEDDGNAAGGGKIEKPPIEFTGEVRNFTIPAGAKIFNVAGKETTLESIKKGSLVQLVVNDSTGAVESLMVW